MTSTNDQPPVSHLPLLAPPLVAAFLLFAGLGGAGLWEPHETGVLDLALSSEAPGDAVIPPVTRALIAASVALLGRGEYGARVPGAVLCWLAVLVVHLTLLSLSDRRTAAYGALALAASPACLFHGRQLTGDAAIMLFQAAATAGLALAAYAPTRRAAAAGVPLAATGLLGGALEVGLLSGVVLPAATVLAALALTGDVAGILTAPRKRPGRRVAVATVAAVLLVSAAGACLVVMLLDMPDVRAITGGLAAAPFTRLGFVAPLERLAFGWFPWIVVVFLALSSLFAEGRDVPPRPLPALALAGIAVGCLVHVFDLAARGPVPLFLALPVATAVGLALARLDASRAPAALATALTLSFAAVLVRDLAQSPDALFRAHGFRELTLPEDFAPAVPAALAAAPFGFVLLLLGLIPRQDPSRGLGAAGDGGPRFGWRRACGPLAMPVAAAVFGGWIAFSMVPELSRALSPRHVVGAFSELQERDEPLAVLGRLSSLPAARRLDNTGDLVRWLDSDERVFALMPPRFLAAMDRSFRQRHGRHLHVADARNERFWLVTNRPRPGEDNENPLAGFVFSGRFETPPRNQLEVDFDGKVTLLGWELESAAGPGRLRRGGTYRLATYWRCDAIIGGNYRVFVHFDGPGPRINGDHNPVRGALPTRDWRPGDLVLDAYEGSVPAGQTAGSYNLKIGMFRGSRRLPVTDPAPGAGNAVTLGRVELDPNVGAE